LSTKSTKNTKHSTENFDAVFHVPVILGSMGMMKRLKLPVVFDARTSEICYFKLGLSGYLNNTAQNTRQKKGVRVNPFYFYKPLKLTVVDVHGDFKTET
jgi:hypothetical protein